MNEFDMVYENTVCFTGHRPGKLVSYNYRHPENLKMLLKLRALICRLVEKKGMHTFISGMALGIDMWAAQIILDLQKKKYHHIKLVCAIPCKEQYSKWNKDDKAVWQDIVDQSNYIHYVSREAYTHWCMNDRNKWMVDNSRFVIGVWDGSKGGTKHCIDYAMKRQRSILQLHPKTLNINFL